MWYPDFINFAVKNAITQADNGKWYLEPEWRLIINGDNVQSMQFEGESDPRTLDQIEDVLKLEVERRNISNDKTPYVMNWLHEIITTVIDPAVIQEETDYIKNVVEFMKANPGIEDGQEKADGKETNE